VTTDAAAAEAATRSATVRGVLLYCAALLVAAGMDALVKLASDRYATAELLVWRSVGAMPFVLAAAALGAGVRSLLPRNWAFVLGRGAILAVATGLFFWSLRGLDLATAYVITFSLPLTMTVMAILLLGERVPAAGWLPVGIGFAGVGLAVAPRLSQGEHLVFDAYAAAAFAATLLYALALLLVRKVRGTETNGALVFWGLVAMAAVAVPLAAAGGWRAPDAADLPLLLGIAATAAASQGLVTAAFATAEASRLAPYEYTTLVWGVLLGAAIWGDVPSAAVLGGAGLVVAAALLAARRR
jgi:S-adenosylmethionine uptake transporter